MAIRYCDMVGYRRYRLIREVFKNYLTDFFRFYVHIAHILKGVFFHLSVIEVYTLPDNRIE